MAQIEQATIEEHDDVLTLTVDIGGTKLKACLVDRNGQPVSDAVDAPTPQPSPPEMVMKAIGQLIAGFKGFARISIGFPGVVRGRIIATAPNLGANVWAGFDIVTALSSRYGVPVRVLNDAAVQGLGVVRGPGIEAVITLGTGIGCAVFRDRRFLLHLELALDAFAGNAVLGSLGLEGWNQRIAETAGIVLRLTACERLYVGGGNARKVSVPLPPQVEIVSNMAGLTGGVRLWEAQFDDLFTPIPTRTGKKRP